MPRHPISPPFKSTIVPSGDKSTKKSISTIPKSVVEAKWDQWLVKKTRDNRLLWLPANFENIADYLMIKWKQIFLGSLDTVEKDAYLQFMITYDRFRLIQDNQAWQIVIREITGTDFKKKWMYTRNAEEYLVFVLKTSVAHEIQLELYMENKIEQENAYQYILGQLKYLYPEMYRSLSRMPEIIKDALNILLGNINR